MIEVGFLIGTVQVPPTNASRSTITANLNNIYVKDFARQQGIGTKLFNAFQKFCQENHVEKINVTVNSQNHQAATFYEKCNFTPSRIIMTKNI